MDWSDMLAALTAQKRKRWHQMARLSAEENAASPVVESKRMSLFSPAMFTSIEE